MTKRSVRRIALLNLATIGIYPIFWVLRTVIELRSEKDVKPLPSIYWLCVPLGALYLLYHWSKAIEQLTSRRLIGPAAFLLVLVAPIGTPIIQRYLNKAVDERELPKLPEARLVE